MYEFHENFLKLMCCCAVIIPTLGKIMGKFWEKYKIFLTFSRNFPQCM